MAAPVAVAYPAGAPRKKIDLLRGYMSAGSWHAALHMAARFPRLGGHKVRITRAWDALANPRIYREMGRDVDALVADGIAALKERYGDCRNVTV
jgi:hypothetical protein